MTVVRVPALFDDEDTVISVNAHQQRKGGCAMKNRLLTLLLAVSLVLAFPVGSHATPFSSLIAYGDSLSDNGNIGRFTDGAIWVEILAASLGVDLYDFAYGGATTGEDNPAAGEPVFGLQWQVETFRASADDALYSEWAGGNDFLQRRSPFGAADNIGAALETLYTDGARAILVGSLPDIGATPAFYSGSNEAAATGWTTLFNHSLEAVLAGFEERHDDAILYRLDAYGLFAGFTPGTAEWAELFWVDGFHPSSIGHQLIADTAYCSVVPEPATLLLIGAGLIGLAALGRLKRIS
jgi:phospholipase/lecithinase/hemolysin